MENGWSYDSSNLNSVGTKLIYVYKIIHNAIIIYQKLIEMKKKMFGNTLMYD